MAKDLPDDGGYLLLWRRFEDHPYWQEERVFSYAEAFLDCFAFLAAHTPYTKRVRGDVVALGRGEFLASVRYLSERWKWGHGKVERFIAATRESGELEQVRGTRGGTVYRVVNYDTYQLRRDAQRDANGTQAGRKRDEKKQDKAREAKKELSENGALFELAWAEYPKHGGHSKAAAKRAWDARIKKDPDAAGAMLAGVKAYAAHCKAHGTEQTYIKHAATFFGPNLHYLDPVPADDPKVVPLRKTREEIEYEEFVDRVTAEWA